MKTATIRDKYNTVKTWNVKVYARGEYYLSQSINGKRIYSFTRRSQKDILNVLSWLTKAQLNEALSTIN